MIFVIVTVLAVFFAVNMGGASFAASFAASYGGKALDRRKACLLFLCFVALGAVLFGKKVSGTLGSGITTIDYNTSAVIVILLSAGLSMFVSNIMKIPQSTSLVTVAAIVGVGLYKSEVNTETIMFMVPFWLGLPVLAYVLTKLAAGYIYPPRKENFWIYEQLVNHRERLKLFIIICSCYNAFSVGTNNVANVVGPVTAGFYGGMNLFVPLMFFGLIYGIGAWVFTGPLKTAGDQIVPLGLMTASIISLISGTLMFIASVYGVPQSFVMLQMAAIFAIGSVKHGDELTFSDPIAKRTLFTWTINPIVTLGVSYGLCYLIR